MVREVKPLTSIVPIAPVGHAAAQSAAPRRGRLVLEVQDPGAIAALGEQLSLANQLITPLPDEPAAKSPRSRKRATGSQTTGSQTTGSQTTVGKATTSKATTSKAKQQSPAAPSITVPLAPAVEVQMLDRVQQLSQTIEQLQSQLAQLHRSGAEAATPLAHPAPTAAMPPQIHSRKSRRPAAAPLHLPDWHEPELRSHYTLEESARAYAALEALHSHRKLQTADAPEIDQAYAVADRLRHYQAPINLPDRRTRRTQRRPLAANPGFATVARPRRAQWRWNRQAGWRNLQQFGQQFVQSYIPVPVDPWAKVVDVVVWVAGAIALRLLLKGVIYLLPPLALPLNLLMAIPAIVAAYLAFCVPNSRSDVIYRLLLVTLGLFLGSRV
jgi:hypothetical protein